MKTREMIIGGFIGMFAAFAAALMITSCSPAMTKAIVKGAVDVLLAQCIAENGYLDEAALKETCKYADELAPVVKDLLASQKKGMATAAAKKCEPMKPEPAKEAPKAAAPADAGAKSADGGK